MGSNNDEYKKEEFKWDRRLIATIFFLAAIILGMALFSGLGENTYPDTWIQIEEMEE